MNLRPPPDFLVQGGSVIAPESPVQADQHGLFALRLLVVMIIAGLAIWMVSVSADRTQTVVMSIGILGTIALGLPILFRRDYDLFEPLTAVFFLYLFGAPIKLCYIATVGEASPYIAERLLNWGPLADMIPGLAVALAGIVSLVIGYWLPSRSNGFQRLLFPNLNRWSGKRLHVVCLLLFGFSLVCFIAFMVTAGVSLSNISAKRFTEGGEATGAARVFSYKYYLYRLAGFSKFATYLSFAWLMHHKRFRHWVSLLFIAMVAQSIMLSIVMSSRAGIALLLIDLLVIGYYLNGRRINLVKTSLVSGFAIVAVMGVLSVRANYDQTIFQVVEKTMAGRDLMDITKTAHIINAVPSKMEYRNGEMLYGWATALIPRSMWPDKPMWMERGPYILRNVYNSKNRVAGVPPGYIAELYWNFGLLGVLIGMGILGYFIRTVYVCFVPLSQNPVSVLIYTFFLTRFVLVVLGNDLASGFVKMGLDLIPLLLLLYLIRMPQSQQNAVRASSSPRQELPGQALIEAKALEPVSHRAFGVQAK